MNQHRQPEGIPTGGQYAANSHSDAVPALNAAPSGRQLMERRRNRLAEVMEFESLLAVDSAKALAAHTRELFPTAQTIHFEETDRGLYEALPWKITDADGGILAGERDWDTRQAFATWRGSDLDEENADSLARDLGRRGARLTQAITPVARVGYPADDAGLNFELDLDQVLEGTHE